jgi:succinoglycan biosynthesis protein ExoA
LQPDTGARNAGEDWALAVIPCLNERDHIGELITHVLDDPDWNDPLLVVADGGSTDGSIEIVRKIAQRDARVRLLANPGRIQSAGVNLAAARYGAGRRWIVRIDAHAGYPKGYVSALVGEARRTGAQSIVVAMTCEGRTCFQKAAAAAQNSVLGAGGSAHRRSGGEAFVDHGHHALMELDRFLSIGGYDEDFSHNEDAEYDHRLTGSGGKVWLTRKVSVIYYPRRSAPALLRQYVNHGRGRARTIRKHRMRPRLRQLLPAAVAPALGLTALVPVSPIFALPAALWALASLGFGLTLGLRRKSACAAVSGIAAMIMHLGWSAGFWIGLFSAARAARPLTASKRPKTEAADAA